MATSREYLQLVLSEFLGEYYDVYDVPAKQYFIKVLTPLYLLLSKVLVRSDLDKYPLLLEAAHVTPWEIQSNPATAISKIIIGRIALAIDKRVTEKFGGRAETDSGITEWHLREVFSEENVSRLLSWIREQLQ